MTQFWYKYKIEKKTQLWYEYKNSGLNIEENAHVGNTTQNIHPPLMQKTRIHI